MDENNRPVESLSEATGDEVKEQILGTPEPGLQIEIETAGETSAIEALSGSSERPEQGPSDEQIFFEEGFTAEHEAWLRENPVEGLVEPQTSDDVRANARLVREAHDRDVLEQEIGIHESENALRVAREVYEQGYDPYEVAAALAEGPHAEQLGSFLETWSEDEPDEAVEALSALVGWKVGRREEARRAAEAQRQGEINAAWNETIAASGLTEAGAELVRSIFESDPARVLAIENPEQAKEVIARTIAEAREIRRAKDEREIRDGIFRAEVTTDMSRGWSNAGDDDPWEIEPRFRPVERPRETIGEMKRAMLDDSKGAELESLAAENWVAPRSEYEIVRSGSTKRRGR